MSSTESCRVLLFDVVLLFLRLFLSGDLTYLVDRQLNSVKHPQQGKLCSLVFIHDHIWPWARLHKET